jgi:hypothetical protein
MVTTFELIFYFEVYKNIFIITLSFTEAFVLLVILKLPQLNSLFMSKNDGFKRSPLLLLGLISPTFYAFTGADPKSTKNTVKLPVFLRFWDLHA